MCCQSSMSCHNGSLLNQSQGGMCICRVLGIGRESRGSVSALDCRTVRQRRLTSSFRLDSPARNLPTRSCTAALLPKHRLPVTSSLAQPQTASSALKWLDSICETAKALDPEWSDDLDRHWRARLRPGMQIIMAAY